MTTDIRKTRWYSNSRRPLCSKSGDHERGSGNIGERPIHYVRPQYTGTQNTAQMPLGYTTPKDESPIPPTKTPEDTAQLPQDTADRVGQNLKGRVRRRGDPI